MTNFDDQHLFKNNKEFRNELKLKARLIINYFPKEFFETEDGKKFKVLLDMILEQEPMELGKGN